MDEDRESQTKRVLGNINKFLYIVASSVCFGFLFVVGQNIQKGEDVSGTGIFDRAAKVIEPLANVTGHSALGFMVMFAALAGGIIVALLIWREKNMP